MAQTVNSKMIGGFVVGAVAILAVSIVIFGSGNLFRERIQFVLYFDDTIRGLNVGAPVLAKGVKAGTVNQIVVRSFIDNLADDVVAVFIEIYPDTFDVVTESDVHLDPLESVPQLIDQGLRAQLVSQSMVTGQLSIEFVMRPDTAYELKNLDEGIVEIPTVPSALSELGRQLQQINIEELYVRLTSILDSIDSGLKNLDLKTTTSDLSALVNDIRSLVSNLNGEMQTLTNNLNRAIDESRGMMLDIQDEIKPLADNMNRAINESRGMMVDMKNEIKPIAEKTDRTLAEIGALARGVDERIEPVAQSMTAALEAATEAMSGLNELVSDTSPTRDNLDTALAELALAARSLRILAEYLEQQPDALLKGKGSRNY